MKLYTLDEARKTIHVCPERLRAWVDDHPDQVEQIGRRQFLTRKALKNAQKDLSQSSRRPWQAGWEDQGKYTQSAAARYLDMPLLTFRNHVARGVLPPPTHGETVRYYTRAELDKFRAENLKNYLAIREITKKKD